MKHIVLYLAIALLSLGAGYVIGSFRSMHQATIGSNTGSLVWLTAIHEMINRGDYERAKATTESAVDAHVGVLAQVKHDPSSMLIWMIPWAPDFIGEAYPKAIGRANEYFVEENDLLRPETKAFLATTPRE